MTPANPCGCDAASYCDACVPELHTLREALQGMVNAQALGAFDGLCVPRATVLGLEALAGDPGGTSNVALAQRLLRATLPEGTP